MTEEENLRQLLFSLLVGRGARMIGVADLTSIVDGELRTGISVAVPIPKNIVRDLQVAPTKEYYDAYYRLNAQLDDIVSCGAEYLRENGYQAYANTTKVTKPDENWSTPLPHKTVATQAGLGWIEELSAGYKKYGSAVRLSSLLTDAALPPDTPVRESQCGGCTVCVRSCPAQVLVGTLWDISTRREELLRKEDCKQTQVQRMKQATGIDTDLCGLCFAICPYTQRYLKEGTYLA